MLVQEGAFGRSLTAHVKTTIDEDVTLYSGPNGLDEAGLYKTVIAGDVGNWISSAIYLNPRNTLNTILPFQEILIDLSNFNRLSGASIFGP